MTLTTLDWLFLGLLLLSALLGLWRGFISEVMSLGGWFVAGISAIYLCDYLSPYLATLGLSDTLRYALAFAIVFIVTLVLWSILTTIIRNAIGAIGLGALDRVLGAVFGLVRGGIILIVLTVLLGYTPVQKTDFWRASPSVLWCQQIAQSLKPYVPPALAGFIP